MAYQNVLTIRMYNSMLCDADRRRERENAKIVCQFVSRHNFDTPLFSIRGRLVLPRPIVKKITGFSLRVYGETRIEHGHELPETDDEF